MYIICSTVLGRCGIQNPNSKDDLFDLSIKTYVMGAH